MNDGDEQERERIRKLQAQEQATRQEIQLAKMKLEKKQLYDLYEKETKLVDRLEEIRRQKAEENEYNERIRKEVVAMKLKQKKDEEEKKKVDRMLWNMERDNEMEEIVRKKLELERLQENKKYFDDISKRRQLEIEEIDNEKKNRDLESAEMLQKALNHADYIQDQIESGALSTNIQARMLEAFSGDKNDPENKRMREELIEELKAKILQEKERKTMEHEKFIQELNMKRMQFSDAEKTINEQKLLYEALQRRGIDFLSEMELGNGPPMEYVVNNLNIDDKQLNRKEPFSIKAVVAQTRDTLLENQERLEALKAQKLEEDKVVSAISYKPAPIFIPDSTQEVIDDILEIIITKAYNEISIYDQYVESLRKKSKIMKHREPVQDARIGFYSDRIAMKEANNHLINQ